MFRTTSSVVLVRVAAMAAGAACLAGPAAAQTFNVDIDAASGPGAGVPQVTFPGAAATPGRWNAVPPTGAGPFRLLLLNSATSSVTITRTGPAASFGRTPAAITGDHARLLGDIQNIANPTPGDNPGSTLTIAGLAPGDYEIYTYAIAPDSSTLRSIVTVTPSPDPPATVGGTLPANTFTVGITHSVHRFTVINDDDVITLNVRGGTASPGSLSGFQIKQLTPGRLYVDAALTTPTDAAIAGRAWGTAFASIAEALAARQQMTPFANRRTPAIWIARGTYRPATTVDRAAQFVLPSGVEFVGGFTGVAAAGGETAPAQRSLGSPLAPATILSGDLGVANDRTDNSRTVVRLDGPGAAVLDGFTITAGNNDTPVDSGAGVPGAQRPAGIALTTTQATLRNIALTDLSSVGDGAGLAVPQGASVTWTGGFIARCTARSGAGIDHHGPSLITSSIRAEQTRAEVSGGALRVGPTAAASLVGWTIDGSTSAGDGGAIAIDAGAGAVRVVNTRLLRNSAGDLGSAVFAAAPVTMIQCLVDSNAGAGAGLVAAPGSRLINCTIVRNLARAGQTGGVIALPPAASTEPPVEVSNSVLWDNAAPSVRGKVGGANDAPADAGGTSARQAPVLFGPGLDDGLIGDAIAGAEAGAAQITGPALVRTSVVGGLGRVDRFGNTGSDPRFRDPLGPDGQPATTDDRLTVGPGGYSSTGIGLAGRGTACDSGDLTLFNAAAMTMPPLPDLPASTFATDLAGRPRIYDDPLSPNFTGRRDTLGSGAVEGGAIDRGAFETPCPGDTSGDGAIALQELFDFLIAWFSSAPAGDINQNGLVTVEDIFELLERFIRGC